MPWLPRGYSIVKELILSESQKIFTLTRPRPKRLKILIGGTGLVQFVSAIVQEIVNGKGDLKITVERHADKILETAKDRGIDVFILLLDNIIFASDVVPEESLVYKALRLVIHLKAKYKKPIIALCGWSQGPHFPRRARMAGADFVFPIPCYEEELKQAIGKSLGAVSGFGRRL